MFDLLQAAQKGYLPTSRPARGGRGGIRGNVSGMRGGGFNRGTSVYSRGRIMRGGYRGRGRGGSYGSPGKFVMKSLGFKAELVQPKSLLRSYFVVMFLCSLGEIGSIVVLFSSFQFISVLFSPVQSSRSLLRLFYQSCY